MGFELRYRRAVKGLATERTDEGLDTTLNALGIQSRTASRRKAGWAYSMGAALTAGTAAVILAVIPSKAKALSLDDIDNALKSVIACHTVFRAENGKTGMEAWQEGVKRRYRFDNPFLDIDRAFDGKQTWAIFRKKRYVEISSGKLEGFGMTQGDLASTIREMRGCLKEGGKVATAETKLDGRPATKVTVEGLSKQAKGISVRMTIYADLTSKLPVRTETYTLQRGAWKRSGWATIDYPPAFSKDVFELHVPNGFAVYDYTAAAKLFKDAMRGEGPSQTIEGVKVTLIGAFQEGFNGGIWVYWTGGATPPVQSEIGIFDEKGKGLDCEVMFELDDRRRPRNHGNTSFTIKSGAQNPQDPTKRIIQLRPLGWIDGQPYYGMRTRYTYSGQQKAALGPREITVAIPVCKEGAMKVGRYLTGFYRANGTQVGTAKFKVTTIPVYTVLSVTQGLDPDRMPAIGSMPSRPLGLN